MLDRLRNLIEERRHKRALRRWEAAGQLAGTLSLSELRELRRKARQIRRRVDAINHVAVSRLTLPVIGSKAIRKPARTEWAHRPEAWSGPVVPSGVAQVKTKTRIGSELTIFHDCPKSEMAFRQVRNTREEDFAPFGLRMDVFNFDGSFLSLAIEMPPSALEGLKRTHLIGLNTVVDSERPQEIFARLNIRHGPNTEQIVRELDQSQRENYLEFDLFGTQFNEDRGEGMWIDLIFEGPSMNQVTVRDLTVIRRPRANI